MSLKTLYVKGGAGRPPKPPLANQLIRLALAAGRVDRKAGHGQHQESGLTGKFWKTLYVKGGAGRPPKPPLANQLIRLALAAGRVDRKAGHYQHQESGLTGKFWKTLARQVVFARCGCVCVVCVCVCVCGVCVCVCIKQTTLRAVGRRISISITG